jgi:hypothetical protein
MPSGHRGMGLSSASPGLYVVFSEPNSCLGYAAQWVQKCFWLFSFGYCLITIIGLEVHFVFIGGSPKLLLVVNFVHRHWSHCYFLSLDEVVAWVFSAAMCPMLEGTTSWLPSIGQCLGSFNRRSMPPRSSHTEFGRLSVRVQLVFGRSSRCELHFCSKYIQFIFSEKSFTFLDLNFQEKFAYFNPKVLLL